MLKIITLSLVTLFSCHKINDSKGDESLDKEAAIEIAIVLLKELDESNSYNLYYVIETTDNLLYVVNTNKDNRVDFMYFFDTIACESIDENEFIIYLIRKSDNPQKDNCVETNFNLPNYFGGKSLIELNGIILKKIQENKSTNYIIIKEGNILKEIMSDPNLIIEVEVSEG